MSLVGLEGSRRPEFSLLGAMNRGNRRRVRLRARLWNALTRAYSLVSRREPHACLVLATTPLTVRYADMLSAHLRAAGIAHSVLDVGHIHHKRDLGWQEFRSLFRRWGAVVLFDHVSRWSFHSPVVRLPHGIRP